MAVSKVANMRYVTHFEAQWKPVREIQVSNGEENTGIQK
jgi:hypothetical protein